MKRWWLSELRAEFQEHKIPRMKGNAVRCT